MPGFNENRKGHNHPISSESNRRIEEWLRQFFLAQRRGQSPDVAQYLSLLEPDLQAIGSERLQQRRQAIRGTLHLPALVDDSHTEHPKSSANPNNETLVPNSLSSTQHHIDWPIEAAQPANQTEQGDLLASTNHPSASSNEPGDTELTDAELDPTSELVGYEILGELGRGAFGVVYRAQDVLLDRQVAIKVPLLNDPRTRQQYIDEARKAVRLEHPGIVPIYHVGTAAGGQPFVVQKLIEGPTLRELFLSRGGVLPIVKAVRLLLHVCRAVAVAHARGMVHRDLKPENLLIDAHENPWVADFGLALMEEEQSKRRGEVAGTPLYMSPEQLQGRTDWLDGRSDIWSIGVMLYEMIAGKAPFEGDNFSDLQEQIRHRDPRPLHQRSIHVPKELDAIFQKCCAKKVTDRYASANELAAELEAFLDATDLADDFAITGTTVSSHRSVAVSTKQTRSNGKSRMGASALTDSSARPSVPAWMMMSMVTAVVFCGLATCFAVWITVRGQRAESDTISSASDDQAIRLAADGGGIGQDNLGNLSANTNPSIGANVVAGSGNRLNPSRSNAPGNAAVIPAPTPISAPGPTAKPQPPYKVSAGGSGTHTSLASAIADAGDGDTIYVLEGMYFESLEIKQNLRLVGEGDRSKIVIRSSGKPCMVLANDVDLHVSNLHMDSQGKPTNTLDIQQGSLWLEDCDVYATSWDCVKVRPGGGLNASRCIFDTAQQPAIQAVQAQHLIVQNSKFRFSSSRLQDAKKIGIQAENCKGVITDCDFEGKCQAAIDWRDSTGLSIQIEGCLFRGCLIGVSADNCGDLKLVDSVKRPCEFSDCAMAVLADESRLTLEHVTISSEPDETSVAIKVQNGAEMLAKDCVIAGYNVGIRVLNGSLEMSGVEILNCRTVAINGYDGNLTLDQCIINGKQQIGILTSGARGKLESTGLKLAGSEIGLYLVSGRAELIDTHMNDCSLGVAMGYQKKILDGLSFPDDASVSGERESDPRNNRKENSAPEFFAQAFVLQGASTGIRCFAAGTYEFDGFKMVDAKAEYSAFSLDPHLERISVGRNRFEIRKRIEPPKP